MANRTLHIINRPPLAAALRLAGLWVFYMAVFEVLRALFMVIYSSAIAAGADECLAAMGHGLVMDATVAAYFAALPGLLLALAMVVKGRWLRVAIKIYLALAAAAISVIYVTDMSLYGHWGFRLDSTPVFYFMSSPRLALASATTGELLVGTGSILVLWYGIWFGSSRIAAWQPRELPRRRYAAALGMVFVTALLFIPIRGGFTVSTMNLSRAYFSANQRLNHAAVNPVFSLLYSATHADSYSDRYRFYPEAEARRLAATLEPEAPAADSLRLHWLGHSRPDIYLIILESFSAHLLPGMGGEAVAMRLDSLARGGVTFAGVYASGFRTDRALPAILNAVPSQPSASLLKYVDKVEKLPSLAAELRRQGGYGCSYYYGGDVNFTNMKALLVSGGYDRIVSDIDFPIASRTGKWGAHDGDVFRRALADVTGTTSGQPRFVTIQTSSSHEPFEVPARFGRYTDDRCNAFAYADSCMGAFVQGVMDAPRTRPCLFVLVPDHYGAYPVNIDDMSERHHVPLVVYGDAVATPGAVVTTPGSQPDIAATLLGAMGLDASRFGYSHDLALPSARAYAYFCEPGMIGMITAADTVYVNVDADGRNAEMRGSAPDSLAAAAKAYLQVLYTNLSEL